MRQIDQSFLVVGDTPEQLNTKCVNWVDVLVVDGQCYDKEALRAILVARDAAIALNNAQMELIELLTSRIQTQRESIEAPIVVDSSGHSASVSDYVIEPKYMDDIELIKDMCPNELERFTRWFERLEAENNGKNYTSPLVESTGIKCWLDYFVAGYEPQDALEEDLRCSDGN